MKYLVTKQQGNFLKLYSGPINLPRYLHSLVMSKGIFSNCVVKLSKFMIMSYCRHKMSVIFNDKVKKV